eukprot:TRINITY_DN11678_c0_g1_i3.p1 TRINITY_DN11678_c0_g1~~TRINITY_DN11678_c0_g1_i3.p1  ORF type:complete len:296 (-),score=55.59 TRINITY_DN11678_c0_g1_i3:25-912(-)
MPTSLVTGGNRGIGLEVVKILLRDDAAMHVFLGCRDLQAGQKLASALCDAHGPRVEAVQLDVTSEESIVAAVATIGARQEHLDILVNNAGILGADSFDAADTRHTIRVNFESIVAVTRAFLPMLSKSPNGGNILSTSSGTGTRTLGLLNDEHRRLLTDPNLDVITLQKVLAQIVDEIDSDPCHVYRDIPTVGYGLSKMGVNCFTQIVARWDPSRYRANACSPGFCNTGMCANYTGARQPKDPELGADVFAKVLFGELGRNKTGLFFKEGSKPGTPLQCAKSSVDDWVAFPAVGGQ